MIKSEHLLSVINYAEQQLKETKVRMDTYSNDENDRIYSNQVTMVEDLYAGVQVQLLDEDCDTIHREMTIRPASSIDLNENKKITARLLRLIADNMLDDNPTAPNIIEEVAYKLLTEEGISDNTSADISGWIFNIASALVAGDMQYK